MNLTNNALKQLSISYLGILMFMIRDKPNIHGQQEYLNHSVRHSSKYSCLLNEMSSGIKLTVPLLLRLESLIQEYFKKNTMI